MTDEETEPTDDYLTLGDFLNEYYSQFAIMGIFGTVSVFLSSNFPDSTSELVARSAIFASLTIFGFTAFWLCWRALTELLNQLHTGERPVTTEFGYTVLVLCTGTLALAIGSAITTYADIAQLAGSIGVIAGGFVIYVREFPNERYRGETFDPAGVAMVSGIGLFFALPMVEPGLQRVTTTHSLPSMLSEAAFLGIIATTHLTICEALTAGLKSSMEFDGRKELRRIMTAYKQPTHLRAYILSYSRCQWPFHFSVVICLANLCLLFLGLRSIADQAVEPPAYYRVAGYHWEEIVFYAVIGVTSIVSGLVWAYPETDKTEAIRKTWGKRLAGVLTVITFSTLVLAWLGYIGGSSIVM